MEVTVDMIIAEILRQMFEDSTLDDKGKERIYKRIFDNKRNGEMSAEK